MEIIHIEDLKGFLDEKAEKYNQPFFIEHDPIQVPKAFSDPKDIEIAALLTATITWGNRKSIINNAQKMMRLMENNPYDFVMNAADKDLEKLNGFVHRTFNDFDFKYFVKSLNRIYQKYDSLEAAFLINENEKNPQLAIERFRDVFFLNEKVRTNKHVSSTKANSAAKRINMFLRWMVRNDQNGVDFGIWNQIPMAKLSLPLDVHTANVGRKLGLIYRKPNDWKTVEEVDLQLRALDSLDPVKYDFALFGLGAFEKF